MTATATAASTVGRTELGAVTISESVVTAIASRAASEIPDAGAAAPRVLGRALPGAGLFGTRATSLDKPPEASAAVDGSVVLIHLSISVRWPCSVPAVTRAVRQRVRDRVETLTSLRVDEINIAVTSFATHLAPPPRAR
jgi:uncharacterized alkaline shock family protein YloU